MNSTFQKIDEPNHFANILVTVHRLESVWYLKCTVESSLSSYIKTISVALIEAEI